MQRKVWVHANIFVRYFCSQNGVRSVYLLCISSSYCLLVSKRLREEANRVPAKKRTVYKCAYVQGWLVQLARNILQLFLLTPGHVSLHVNLPLLLTVCHRTRSSIYDSMKVNESSQAFIFIFMTQ